MKFRSQVKTGMAVIVGMLTLAVSLPAQTGKLNVILIAIDQTQADRLHSYGNVRETSPNIDRLAEEGVRFSQFYSVAPWTTPSYATLMTGLFPSKHGATLFFRWHPDMQPVVDPNTPMLAQSFKADGYSTGAFVANALGGKGLTDRGFDDYYQYQEIGAPINVTERSLGAQLSPYRAPDVVNRLLPWLDQHKDKPFFTFVLFWEPHSPYNPPPEDDLFKSDAFPTQTVTGYDLKDGNLLRLASLRNDQALERLYQLYDGKIHYVDRFIGQIYDYLKQHGLDQNTLIVLTSDHGELMFSHRDDFMTADHRSLYNPVLHIPFILWAPSRLPHGKVVEALGSNVDSAATILDVAGLSPLKGAEGVSLLPLVNGEHNSASPYVFSEEDIAIPQRSVRDPHYKLIYNLWTGQKQLFDQQKDPAELNDVAKKFPDVTSRYFSVLNEWLKQNQPSDAVLRARWAKFTAGAAKTVIDDQTIGGRVLLQGAGWHSDENPADGHWEGGAYWTEAGDGSRSATWRSDDPLLGRYNISVYFGKLPGGNAASNAEYTIVTAKARRTVKVDLRRDPGQWHSLGTFDDPRTVTLNNHADGPIVVDAVKFEREGKN